MEDIAALQRQWKSLLELNNGSETSFDSSLVPAFATLIVNDEQAVKLANEEYSGTIHLVLHPNIEGEAQEDNTTQQPAQQPVDTTEPELDADGNPITQPDETNEPAA